ncbi:MAG: hydrogenase nickel incorporation protein HypA [Alkalinema sp. CACIAM 70d]|nr:MAG: hydrogenase nickel incorporation protein HypA [Alkalinema sp. CACIAM 70d]
MHEASLLKNLIETIHAIVMEQQGIRATSIKVQIGALSHLTPEHFRSHFHQAAQGTVAENARLEITALDNIKDPLAQEILLESVEVEMVNDA